MVSKLKAWWGLIFNTVSLLALATMLAELTGYLAVFPWSSLVSTETALMIAMGMNVANIILRFITVSAVRNV